MKFTDIKEMSNDELIVQRRDFKMERINLRLQQQSGQLENPSRLRIIRRNIAQIETVLTARRAVKVAEAAK
ncbi:MAG: large subunit ribosomal protein L29 [Pseudoalteromonas tetraodonis]|jgi:large subunit ribosomal protein L29